MNSLAKNLTSFKARLAWPKKPAQTRGSDVAATEQLNGTDTPIAAFSRRWLRLSPRSYWLVIALGLIGPYLLSRRVEAHPPLVFRQLTALFIVDSILFFFVDRTDTKIGLLTLIFLVTMELFVVIYYVLAIYGGVSF